LKLLKIGNQPQKDQDDSSIYLAYNRSQFHYNSVTKRKSQTPNSREIKKVRAMKSVQDVKISKAEKDFEINTKKK